MPGLYWIAISGAFAAIAFYFIAICYIGIQAIKVGNQYVPDQIVSAVITIIGGTLATHFGMVFGFERANSTGSSGAATSLTLFQTGAAWAYVLSLMTASGFMVFNKFIKKQESPDALLTLTMTLIGVVAGLLAVSLNVAPPAALRTNTTHSASPVEPTVLSHNSVVSSTSE